jgi:hypothetical protein
VAISLCIIEDLALCKPVLPEKEAEVLPMATSTHATSNNEVAKRASEESGKVFKDAGDKSYSSSLEAEEELNKNIAALGKLTVSSVAHQKTANRPPA